jgi:chromosome segregation protein
MVKIQKLVLKNFKSFKKAEVPFAGGFTAIAGSNGSGKSNLLDAMLFAMGATSLKMLRASRLTDLVNNDAVENYAKVELHLKHDGQRYEIGRMIDRQGKSVYRLNGSRVTLNEVSSLLAELGVKPTGHNIVMQGDITRVIEMSPEERRQIIDELAGLQEFDEKKEEAMKNLAKVESKIRETSIVLQERENHLEELEKEREAALLFGSLEKEKRQLKASILLAEIEKIRAQLGENEGRAAEAAAKREKLLERASEVERRIAAAKEKAKQLNESILAATERIFSTVGAKLEEKRSQIAVNEERLERKEELVARNSDRIREVNEKIRALGEERKLLENEKITIESELPETEREVTALEEQKKEMEKAFGAKQSQLHEIEAKIRGLGKKIELLRREELSKQGEAEALRRRQALEKEKLQELLEGKKHAESIIVELEKKQRLLGSLYAKEKQPAAALQKSREDLERKISESKRKQALIDSLEEKAAVLRRRLAECPVCENPLEEEKRKQLLGKTSERIKLESISLSRLLEEEKNNRKRIAEMETLALKERELLFALRSLPSERERKRALEEKIGEVKDSLSGKMVEAIEGEARKAGEQASALVMERERLEEKRNAILEKLELDKLNKLNALLNRALNKKSLAEQRLKQIETALASRLNRDAKLLHSEIGSLNEESTALKAEIEQGRKELASLERDVKELEARQGRAEEENKEKIKKKDRVEEELEALSEKLSLLQQKIRSLEQQENQLGAENSGIKVRLSDLEEEFEQYKGEKIMEKLVAGEAKSRLETIEKQIAELGAINMKAVESFKELADEVEDVKAKL